MDEMKLSNGKVLDDYTAVGLAEGFVEMDDITQMDLLLAWSYIGKHALYLTLQGWFGRGLRDLVNGGQLDHSFNIISRYE